MSGFRASVASRQFSRAWRAETAPEAIRLQKALLRDWEELPLREAVERGIDCLAEGFAGDEPRRRMRAFLNRKR